MKNWTKPELSELDLNETAQDINGQYPDGSNIGDDILGGHATNDITKATDPCGNICQAFS